MHIELRYIVDCPNWRAAGDLIWGVVEDLGLDATFTTRLVGSPEEAVALGFRGSPTIMVDGEDPFAVPDAPIGLSCRIYHTAEGMAGSPTSDQVRAALMAAT